MAATTTELQLVTFHYLLGQTDEARELFEAAKQDESKQEDFELVFEEVIEKRSELLANFLALCAKNPVDDEKVIEECKAQFATYEIVFRELKKYYVKFKRNAQVTPAPPGEHSRRQGGHHSAVLPALPLPMFGGNKAEWRGFSELFNSIVGQAQHLSCVQKLHYLLGCLRGEALELVHNIPVTEGNYDVIWQLLEKKFKSARISATIHVHNILHLPHVASRSMDSLSRFVTVVEENISALKAQGFPVDKWDFLLLNVLLEKLDSTLRQDFELYHDDDIPSYTLLLKFLEKKARAAEQVQLVTSGQPPPSMLHKSTVSRQSTSGFNRFRPTNPAKYYQNVDQAKTTLISVSDSSTGLTGIQECPLCQGGHLVTKCQMFLAKGPKERKDFVILHKLCFNCLRLGHVATECHSKYRCQSCRGAHHSLIHLHQTTARDDDAAVTEQRDIESTVVMCAAHHKEPEHSTTTILLKTALILVRDGTGQHQVVRALLDGASQSSFISEACVHRLGLKRQRTDVGILGIGQSRTDSKGTVLCEISSSHSPEFVITSTALILNKITGPLPSVQISTRGFNHLNGIPLADPRFATPGPVEMLLAADVVAEVMTGAKIVGEPHAFHTMFGWVVTGSAPCASGQELLNSGTSTLLVRTDTSLDAALQKFWELEEVPVAKVVSSEDQYCEDYFTSTVQRDQDGRYIVRLPFKSGQRTLSNTTTAALRRLHSLERRLHRMPELEEQYHRFMKEYEELGHMTYIGCLEHGGGNAMHLTPGSLDVPAYVIPHQVVVKEESVSTKVRVVFDASSKVPGGPSLNDSLHSGPKLQKDIFDIVMNFRTHPVALTADICKMFRQILLNPVDRDFQCILWRRQPANSVNVYKLNTLTYGLASSPFLALRTLQQLAIDEGDKYPLAAHSVMNDMFVDDIVTGTTSMEEAHQLKEQLIALLEAGGFKLHKWCSNYVQLLDQTEPNMPNNPRSFDSTEAVKVLGLRWDPVDDNFHYKVCVPDLPATKRGILSTIARLYDPCGWVAPVVTASKILLQTLWTRGLDWDEPVGSDIMELWTRYKTSLPRLSEVKVRRFVPVKANDLQFHGFCDASERAYAAVIYARTVHLNGLTEVYLLASKSKVAPLKTISVPRLELCAAMLLCKLWQTILRLYESKVSQLDLNAWTDSTTVLSWLRTSPHKLNTFVANRVSEIQPIIPPSAWKHVPSGLNPADSASRGALPDQLLTSQWFLGPEWLVEPAEQWPAQQLRDFGPPPELKSVAASVLVAQVNDAQAQEDPLGLLQKISTLSRLQRIMAWVLRAKAIFLKLPCSTDKLLTIAELTAAMIVCVKWVQTSHFKDDISALSKDQPCSKVLQPLSPFLDTLGVVRVGGRLHHAQLPENAKHPVLLPKQSRLSQLVIQHYHQANLHPGPSATLHLTRQQYWVVSGRSLTRKLLRKCIACFKVKPVASTPLMGNLPPARFSKGQVFQSVGLDFGGPFMATPARTRKRNPLKVYLCIFICMATKAVHLELVTDLSTEAFLAALKRFVSLRGCPAEMFSDNGTNFVGASNHLFTEGNKQQIADESAQKGIKWHFSPPASPHFGGLWEAAIKSAKQLLKRVVGTQLLTFEELATLFAQISAVLNSRPLCELSDDPSEYDVLTPGHFLIGRPLVATPEQDIADVPSNRLSRWQMIEQFQQRLWKRWSCEYLHTLQQRAKWTAPHPNIQVNQLVLVKEPNLPPLKWKTARVVAVHPGQDGVVRVVSLKTVQGSYTRPVAKLCPLPLQD